MERLNCKGMWKNMAVAISVVCIFILVLSVCILSGCSRVTTLTNKRVFTVGEDIKDSNFEKFYKKYRRS